MAFSGGNSAETVIFRYPPRLDTFRRPVADTGVDIVVEECVFAPGTGRENDVHANQVIADGTVFAQPDAPPITAQDQVVIRGQVYEVIEKPRVWLNEAVEIPVRLVTG
jgi:hypothetical protein